MSRTEQPTTVPSQPARPVKAFSQPLMWLVVGIPAATVASAQPKDDDGTASRIIGLCRSSCGNPLRQESPGRTRPGHRQTG